VSLEKCESAATLSEIHNQAKSCLVAVQRAEARFEIFDRLLPLEQYTDIILTGCGSSYNLAKCASLAWTGILRRPIRAVASSELMFYPELYLERHARPLVVAISRTGGTTEVQLAVERTRSAYGARALAVTVQPDSAVGTVCDAELAFTECYEESIVMTQAFTCMLTGLYLVADGAAGWRHKNEISLIPGLIAASLETSEEVVRRIAEDQGITDFFFLGSGAMKGLADECALKLTEMALSRALGHRSLEFRHGPKAALDERSQVIVFPVAAEHPYLETLLAELYATGAKTLVVSAASNKSTKNSCAIVLGQDLPELFRPALYAHVGQLLAFWRAISRGIDPHSPRHLDRTVLLDL
jgi:glucosamine--fructose-6-phosphate aminotransferase (isomerizing)